MRRLRASGKQLTEAKEWQSSGNRERTNIISTRPAGPFNYVHYDQPRSPGMSFALTRTRAPASFWSVRFDLQRRRSQVPASQSCLGVGLSRGGSQGEPPVPWRSESMPDRRAAGTGASRCVEEPVIGESL